MHVLDLLRLAVTGLLLWLLRPHLAVLWRFLFPGWVRHRVRKGEIPGGLWPQEILRLGFQYVGWREETIPLLEKREYHVFHHPDGVFADLPAAAGSSSSLRAITGLYLTSMVPRTLFLITKRVGRQEIRRGLYMSQRSSGSIEEMLRNHRATLLRLGLGGQVEDAGTLQERQSIFTLWHQEHARLELLGFAVLSLVLCLVVTGFAVRMWMV